MFIAITQLFLYCIGNEVVAMRGLKMVSSSVERFTGLDNREWFEAPDAEDEGGRVDELETGREGMLICNMRGGLVGVWSSNGFSYIISSSASMWLTSHLGLFGERLLLRVGVGSAGSEASGVGMSFQLSTQDTTHYDFRVVVRQDMCSMVRGEGDGFQSKQETHGARDVPEDDSSDVIEETDAGSLPGSPILYGIGASSSRRDALPELLLVCRQITDEIKGMLYRTITFTVDIRDGGEAYLASMFSAETLSMIATMTIITRTDILLFIYTSGKIDRYLLR
ncbi:gpi ethanolamine phosphate transferase [Fusarium sporotrichioides]|uniref:Gpi ethanolamine phosphate transferase n=1 Tax=Fusarium sporotrichioides TaxID=5514 RepID=A0A395RQM4_FUSSP|nr:gpi ethanolamine phosphate transferase [Fusarium sporotrichioides]